MTGQLPTGRSISSHIARRAFRASPFRDSPLLRNVHLG